MGGTGEASHSDTASNSSGHKHKAIGLRLDDIRRQQVEELATAERRSLAQMCAILIEEALEARERTNK